ncbi:radical SAM family heme chaperone HemW [Roseobacteraceae bacterium S113]
MISATAPMRSASWWKGVLPEVWQERGFGIYVHWPYCEAKCPYCDFNSYVARSIDHTAWRTAYTQEIQRMAARTGPRVVSSIFFGGGTPSLMEPESVSAVIETISAQYTLSNDVEITLEANPSSVESGKFRDFEAAGINRVSLGVQALNDRDLQRLGRLHSVAEAMHALEIARDHFQRVSFDLIYARQHQTIDAWESELRQALTFEPDHLSMYQLTIEDGTAFGDRYKRGALKGLPIEDVGAEMYDMTQEICDAAGLPAYEVSNHAKPGAGSRHNMIYWKSGDYLGIGPGAHGRLTLGNTRLETTTHTNPQNWLQTALRGPAWKEEALTATDWGVEQVMMGLRLAEPFDLGWLQATSGVTLGSNVLHDLQDDGLLETSGNTVMITPTGRPLLNAILLKLLSDID